MRLISDAGINLRPDFLLGSPQGLTLAIFPICAHQLTVRRATPSACAASSIGTSLSSISITRSPFVLVAAIAAIADARNIHSQTQAIKFYF
jgi:hypothetical protein